MIIEILLLFFLGGIVGFSAGYDVARRETLKQKQKELNDKWEEWNRIEHTLYNRIADQRREIEKLKKQKV